MDIKADFCINCHKRGIYGHCQAIPIEGVAQKLVLNHPPSASTYSSLRANGAFLTSVWLLAIRVCPLDTVKFDLNKKQKSNHHWVVFSWVRTLFAIAIEAAGPISENVAFWCRLWIGMKWTEHCVTWFFVVSMYVWGSSIDSFDSFDQWSNRMTNNKHTIGQEDDTVGWVKVKTTTFNTELSTQECFGGKIEQISEKKVEEKLEKKLSHAKPTCWSNKQQAAAQLYPLIKSLGSKGRKERFCTSAVSWLWWFCTSWPQQSWLWWWS